MNATVDIESWTRRAPGGFQGTRFTLVYVEAGREYRVSTHATEFEARQFARRHGWSIGRLIDGDAPRPAGPTLSLEGLA